MDALTESRPGALPTTAPAMPPESHLAMPVQSLSRFDKKARRKWLLPANMRSPWLARLAVFGGGFALTAYGAHEMYKVVEVGGVTLLKWALLLLFVANFSWIALAFTSGVVGLIWVALWLIMGKEGPLVGAAAGGVDDGRRYPYFALLTTPTFMGSVLATFGAYWVLSVGLTWFTPFIVKGLGFDQKQAGLISILPWVFGATVVLITGWISQRMMGQGASTRVARGILGAAPLVLGGLILMAMPYIESRGMLIAGLVIGSGLCGSIYVVCPPMLGEFTPTSQRGAVIAIYGGLYTIAGVLSAFVMGNVIEKAATPLAGYLHGFMINGAIMIASGLIGLALLRPNTERARLAASGTAVQAKAA